MRSRRRLSWGLVVGFAVGFVLTSAGGRAWAQTPAVPDPAPAGWTTVDPRADEIWAAYHEAFAAAVAGNVPRARQLLDFIAQGHPDHPAASRARTLSSVLAAAPRPAAPPLVVSPPPARDRRGFTRAARAELIVFQTIHGVLAGLELCGALDCTSPRSKALALMGMGGLGLGLSIAGTQGGIRPGDTALLDSGVFWGAWNGLAVSQIADKDRPWSSMLVGQSLGLALGAGLAYGLDPTSGQVALTNTFGLWSSELTACSLLVFADNSSSKTNAFTTLLLMSDVGLVAGGLAARGSNISRGRAGLIDVSGFLGFLLGGLVASGSESAQSAGVSLLLGTGVGLTVGAMATSSWDAPTAVAPSRSVASLLPTTLSLAPIAQPKGGAGLGLAGAF